MSKSDAVPNFQDLLEKARQMTSGFDKSTDHMPRLERNLIQIREAANKMASTTPGLALENAEIKASLLLGSRGFDLQKLSHKLENLNSLNSFEPLEITRDTDIQTFMKNEIENALLCAVERIHSSTAENVMNNYWQKLEDDWHKDVQKIMLPLDGDISFDNIKSLAEQRSYTQSMPSSRKHSTMNKVELAYAKQIEIFNESMISKGEIQNLAKLFLNAASSLGDPNSMEIWTMVTLVSDLPIMTQFNNVYALRTSPQFQSTFLQQAIKYLELTYRTHIEKMVASNMEVASRGGKLGMRPYVEAYIKVKLRQGGIDVKASNDSDLTVWMLIYYCLRCGDLNAVADVIQSYRAILGELEVIFQEYISTNRRLSQKTLRSIRTHYDRLCGIVSNPFKKAIYCVLGRCEPTDNHSEVAVLMEDYLWIKLSQISTDEMTVTKNSLTLPQFQLMLSKEYGEAHFNAHEKPLVYFQVLFLSGQLESSIEFLSRMEAYRCLAVHIAICFNELNLLLVTTNWQTSIIYRDECDMENIRRLNYSRLIALYTNKFEHSDVLEALHYYYLLRKMKSPNGDSMFIHCVSNLILESKEYSAILGQIYQDGQRRKGAIDKFGVNATDVILKVAAETEAKSDLEDAAALYDLASKPNKVIELWNQMLSNVISQPSSSQTNREHIRNQAVQIATRYSEQNVNNEVGGHILNSFHILLDLATFFDAYHAKNYEQAIAIMQRLSILPFDQRSVARKVESFQLYSEDIKRNISEILVATANSALSLAKQSHSINTSISRFNDTSTSDLNTSQIYKTQIHSIIEFSVKINYRLPLETTSKLNLIFSQII